MQQSSRTSLNTLSESIKLVRYAQLMSDTLQLVVALVWIQLLGKAQLGRGQADQTRKLMRRQ